MHVETKLLIKNILQNDSFQLMIPVYQRNYSWTEEYYGQLLEDLCNSLDTKQKNYFLGTFLLKKQKSTNQTTLQNRFWIIDGQQRVTTIYVLIFAILKNFNHDEEVTNWCKAILFNNVGDDRKKAKLKLKLIKTDDKVLSSFILNESNKNSEIVESNDENENDEELKDEYGNNSRLAKVFTFFTNQVKERFYCEEPKISIIDFIHKVLENIQVVQIDIDKRSENEQLIFDRINASGEVLSLVDLIRNFLMTGFQTYAEMKKVYDAKWITFEQLFHCDKEKLKKFMEIYLTAKFYSTPKFAQSKKVSYSLFKEWFYQEIEPKCSNKIAAKIVVLDDLNQFAKYYLTILAQSTILHNMVNLNLIGLFKYFSFLNTTIGLPFLLLMFDDFKNQKININNFEYATYLALNYLIRLDVCHIDKRELDIIFSKLYLDLKKNLHDFKDFKIALNQSIPNSVKYCFPTNDRFSYHLENDELTDKLARTILAICQYGIRPTFNDLNHLNEAFIACIIIFEFNKSSHYFHTMHTIGNLSLTLDGSIEKLNYEQKYNALSKGEFSNLIASLPSPTNLANDENQFISVIKKRFNYLVPIILKNLPDFIHQENHQNSDDGQVVNSNQTVQLPN